jgi:hypothetical protein
MSGLAENIRIWLPEGVVVSGKFVCEETKGGDSAFACYIACLLRLCPCIVWEDSVRNLCSGV